jgi:hypothetical protein
MLVCPPRVEPLEERRLLHGGSPLSPCSVPLSAPPAPSALALAGPSPFVAVRLSGAGPLACAPGNAFPAAGWVVVVFDPGPSRDAAFLSYGSAPRPLPDSPPDYVPHHRADADVGGGGKYGSLAPPAADPGPAAGSDPPLSAALAGRDESVSRPVNADLAAAALSVIISPQTVSAAAAQGTGVCTLISSAGSTAPLAISLVPRARGGDATEVVGAVARNSVEASAEPESPGTEGRPTGQRGEPAPGAGALALPQVQGLLTERAQWGLTALGRAAGALTEPLVIEGGSADVLYWLGCSSWVVAAGLACEGVRRWRTRRPDDAVQLAAPRPEAPL